MHRLSVQCQATDGHDAKANESDEATIGDDMFSFSGKQINKFFFKERNYLIFATKYKNKYKNNLKI